MTLIDISDINIVVKNKQYTPILKAIENDYEEIVENLLKKKHLKLDCVVQGSENNCLHLAI